MSVIQKMAVGMTDFARGVYKGLDNGNTSRLTNVTARNITNSGVMKGSSQDIINKTAKKVVKDSVNSGMGKAGTSFINSAPLAGIADSAKNYMHTPKSGRNALDAIKKGHMTQKTINGVTQDSLSMKKVAGTAATIGVAGRVASGGGLYKDRYGNTNLPGIPFI